MFHERATEFAKPNPVAGVTALIKLGAAIVASAMVLDAGPAYAQGPRHGHKKQDETYYTIVFKYRGTGAGELSVTDLKQSRKEILRTNLSEGRSEPAKAFATITRTTQDRPETEIQWKLSKPKPDAPNERISWCGHAQTSRRHATVDVGFSGSVMGGQSC